MKILLITAESEKTRHLRNGRIIKFPQATMPLLAALTPGDVNIDHIDEIIEKVKFDRSYDLVAISATTCTAPHAYEIADEYRATGVPVVLGGPHPTLLPQEAKEHADSVVIGEAEVEWPKLIRDFKEGKLKPFYKSLNPPSLEGLPWVRRDLIRKRRYGRGVLIASRSCPNKCGYCMLPYYYHHKYRTRPVEEVISEIASINEKAIIFWDDNIVGDKRYAKELFRALIPYKKWWTSQATIDFADDDELIKLAAQSGCQAIFTGLESISLNSLIETGKSTNRPNRYIEAVKKLHAAGIAVQAGIVFGFDNDDKSIFERTLDFLVKAGVDVASIGSLTPFPSTPLFKSLKEQNRIITYDWSKYNARTDVVIKPKLMTTDELQAGVEWVTREFYSINSISKRLRKSKTGLWWNIPRNLGYKIAFDKLNKPGFNPVNHTNLTIEKDLRTEY